jgi:hypothetical protein
VFGPVVFENIEGLSTQQEIGGRHEFGHELTGLFVGFVEIWRGPATKLEAARLIFVGSARRLHHSVERNEFLDRYLSHGCLLMYS